MNTNGNNTESSKVETYLQSLDDIAKNLATSSQKLIAKLEAKKTDISGIKKDMEEVVELNNGDDDYLAYIDNYDFDADIKPPVKMLKIDLSEFGIENCWSDTESESEPEALKKKAEIKFLEAEEAPAPEKVELKQVELPQKPEIPKSIFQMPKLRKTNRKF